MIEAALYFALGALSVSLLLFAILPIISGRARRLAIHELERQAPVSLSEITAEKDQMRARFAVELNRQEKRADQLQAETHQHLVDAEKWRAYAERIELDFDKLTSDYAALKKKISSAELDLKKQKDIAKSALKTMTGQEKKRLFALEEEVDQLRAEKSTANVRIVSLQTELSNAQSRISAMERHMPSLEELSLRKELKALAEDVGTYIRSAPPPAPTPAKPASDQPPTQPASANPPAATPQQAESALLVKAPPKLPLMTPAMPEAGGRTAGKAEPDTPAASAPRPEKTIAAAVKPAPLTEPTAQQSAATASHAGDKNSQVRSAARQAGASKDKNNADGESGPAAPPENTAKPVPSGVVAAVAGNNKQVLSPHTKSNATLKPGSPAQGKPAAKGSTPDRPVAANTGTNGTGAGSNSRKPEPVTAEAAETPPQKSGKTPQNPEKTVDPDENARGVKAGIASS